MTALTEEQSRLVEQHLPRVRSLARTLAHTVSHADFDELNSAGAEGLIEAAQRYDPASGTPFVAFAHYRIKGAMIDAARRAAPQLRRRTRAVRALEGMVPLWESWAHPLPSAYLPVGLGPVGIAATKSKPPKGRVVSTTALEASRKSTVRTL